MGTPLYMSPEQCEGRPIDCRTNIYSFGATCYHMLAGRPPFEGETALEVTWQHVKNAPEPLSKIRPDLPVALCGIIHKMLAKKPAERYQTAKELLRDLNRVRDTLGGSRADDPAITAAPLTSEVKKALADIPTESHRLPLRRAWHIGAVVLSLLAAAAVGGVVAWWTQERRDDVRVVDVELGKTNAPSSNREKVQREIFEKAVAPPKFAPTEAFHACTYLAPMYLKQDRLNDANDLFVRLEPFKEYSDCVLLGRLGRAIVLALQDREKDSAKLFRELFPNGKQGEANRSTLKSVLKSEKWRYWIGRALWFNNKNGVIREDVPRSLDEFALDPNAPPDAGKPTKQK